MARLIVNVTTIGTTNRQGTSRRLVRFDVIDPARIETYGFSGVRRTNAHTVFWNPAGSGEAAYMQLDAIQAAADRFVFVNGPLYFVSVADWKRLDNQAIQAGGDVTGAALVEALGA